MNALLCFILLATLENQRMQLFAQFGSMTMHILSNFDSKTPLIQVCRVNGVILAKEYTRVVSNTANNDVGFGCVLLQIVDMEWKATKVLNMWSANVVVSKIGK